ncbi:uncharacterized protein PITG_11346 [Phytophthora infestans T30-4]|uniref:Uncharacterized protein n=2 Tax=Phytophthora infestans TaxID=4787 RepID=D0NIK8_PHYIT|nr:uncharacterized protein PITG_11346 [Phytophthora infestans T30-4]EEY59342.1 hypothetical protein PITG_11346 [Phytophthora infestans T30-4]|eukprot:XP_002900952.1 hypothetical protein PITG_11346 [Phytophthora infestans T30-4]
MALAPAHNHEVRFSASPADHPLTVMLRGDERAEALLQMDTQGPSGSGQSISANQTHYQGDEYVCHNPPCTATPKMEPLHMPVGWRAAMDTHATGIQTAHQTFRPQTGNY